MSTRCDSAVAAMDGKEYGGAAHEVASPLLLMTDENNNQREEAEGAAEVSYNALDETFWSSAKVMALSRDGRDVYAYLILCPEQSASGIMQLDCGLAAYRLKMERAAVDEALVELVAAERIVYDAEANMVLVLNRYEHAPKGRNVGVNVMRDLIACKSAPVRQAFLDRYTEFATPYEHELRIHGGQASFTRNGFCGSGSSSAEQHRRLIDAATTFEALPGYSDFATGWPAHALVLLRRYPREDYPVFDICAAVVSADRWLADNKTHRRGRKRDWRRFLSRWVRTEAERSLKSVVKAKGRGSWQDLKRRFSED